MYLLKKEFYEASTKKHLKNKVMTVEKLAEEYALKQVPNPNPNDAPYTTTGDIYESIKDAFIEGYKAASSNTGDGLSKDNIVESEEKKTDSTGDPLIDKILIEIRGKLVYNEFTRLLKEHLGWHPAELRMTSVKYFVEKGSITGGFFEAIRNIAHQYAAFVLEQPLLNKYKNEVLKSNKQTKEVSNLKTQQ